MSKSKDAFEPWFHEASGFWCKKVKRKLHYLAKVYQTAKRRLRIILESKETDSVLANDWFAAFFSVLANEYLSDVKARRASGPTIITPAASAATGMGG